MSEPMRCQQVSVPLPQQLRSWVEAQAELEDRSLASVIRRCVAQAARAAAELEGNSHGDRDRRAPFGRAGC